MASLKKLLELSKKEKEIKEGGNRSGIIHVKHIPHGFYEKELKGFFSQFGTVKRAMVARSKKSGRSKGFAFVEFEFEEVAKIAADAMDNYLMFERLIKCQVLKDVDAKKVFKYRWVNERTCPKPKSRIKSKMLQEVPKSEAKQIKIYNYRVKKAHEKNAKLAELGISYEFVPPSTK